MSRFTAFAVGLALCAGLASSAHAQAYYRWAYAPDYVCSTTATGVRLIFQSQPVEWDLPANAGFQYYYNNDGVVTPDGPYPLAAGTGSMVYAALGMSEVAGYPATWSVTLETLVDGQPTYRSTISATCTQDGTGTSTLVNQDLQGGIPALGGTARIALIALLALAGLATLRLARRT